MALELRRTHEDILDPQINVGNLICGRDWNQQDFRATIFLVFSLLNNRYQYNR